MNTEPLMVFLRAVLTVCGAFLMSHGWVNANDWAIISGALLTLAPVLYGMWLRTKPNLIKTAAAVPEVNKVVMKATTDGIDLASKITSTPDATVTVGK